MLKFGCRKMHFYPIMLLLFTFLRRTIEILLKFHAYKDNIDFILPFLIFLSQGLIGFLIHLYYYKKNISTRDNKHNVLSPFKIGAIVYNLNNYYLKKDSKMKKVILIIFASFFNCIGSMIRKVDLVYYGTEEDNNILLEERIRSIQIIISTLLCHYTIRLNIYKHQKLSLIVISFFLTILIFLELYTTNNILYKLITLLFCLMSCLSRSFLDVTEKYLFDFDYIEIFKMLIYEGLIGLFFYIIYFLSNITYQNKGKNFLDNIEGFDWNFAYFILLVLIYVIVSGFKNAYRVATNKYYSPLSRALFESTLDPFIFLINSLYFDKNVNKKNYWIYFSFVILCLTIISFFSLVFNDFIILYCCGLQHNTYSGITERLYSLHINEDNIFPNDDDSSLEDGDEDVIKIELNNDYIIKMK